MANSTQLIYEIQVDSGNSVKTLNSIEQELAQINSELKDTEINSDAFNKLAAQSKLLEGELERVNNTVSNLELSDKLMAADGVIKVATGTLQSFIGSVILFGDESNPALEEFEKKAVATISAAQGLKDLSEGFGQIAQVVTKLPKPINLATKAQTAFNFVLNANPVGAVVLAVTAAVAIFVTFNKRIRESIATFEPLNKVVGFATNLFRKLGETLGFVESEQEKLARQNRELAASTAETLDFELKLLKARGQDTIETERKLLEERFKATEEFSEERKKALQELILFDARIEEQRRQEAKKAREEDLANERKQTEELKKIREERAAAIEEIEKASITTQQEQLAFDISVVNERYDRLIQLAKKYGQDTSKLEINRTAEIEKINQDYNNRIAEQEEERLKNIEELNTSLVDLTIQYINDEEQLREASREREKVALKEQYEELLEQAEKLGIDRLAIENDYQLSLLNLEDRFEAEDKARQAEKNAERVANAQQVEATLTQLRTDAIQNQFDREQELLKQELESETLRLQNLGATEQQITELKKFYADKQVAITEAKTKAEEELEKAKNTEILNATAGLFGSLAGALGEQSKLGKAFAIGDSIIQTYLGVSRALGSAPPPVNFITAAATLAAGIANVAKIKQTNVGKSSGGSTPTATLNAPRGLRDPSQFATAATPNITGPTNQLQQQLQNQIQQSSGESVGRREPIKAYVISGDVRSGLEADAKIRQRRTVGRLKPE